jgi:hypothetical protein
MQQGTTKSVVVAVPHSRALHMLTNDRRARHSGYSSSSEEEEAAAALPRAGAP